MARKPGSVLAACNEECDEEGDALDALDDVWDVMAFPSFEREGMLSANNKLVNLIKFTLLIGDNYSHGQS
jgi:hypothetical protein